MDEHEFHRWLTRPYAAGVDQDGVMAMIYEELDPTQAADDPDAAITAQQDTLLDWIAERITLAGPDGDASPADEPGSSRAGWTVMLTAMADRSHSDRIRLSAIDLLGRMHGREAVRNRLLRLAVTTDSDSTKLAAVCLAARDLDLLDP